MVSLIFISFLPLQIYHIFLKARKSHAVSEVADFIVIFIKQRWIIRLVYLAAGTHN